MAYVELHCHSAYSFLDGASQPEELALRAAELGYEALALTDHDGVYGSLEFAHAAKAVGVRPITGAEVTLDGGAHVTLLVESPQGYANLCRLLTAAHARHAAEGRRAAAAGARPGAARRAERGARLPLRLRARRARRARPERRRARSQAPSGRSASSSSCSGRSSAATRAGTRACATSPSTLGVETVATGNVHAHHPRRTRAPGRRSSRSATAPRSTAASASGAATTRASCARRPRCSSASPTTATPSAARPSSRSGSSST